MLETKDVKVGLYNFMVIGLMAMLFIVLLKSLMVKFPIPGLAEVASAA